MIGKTQILALVNVFSNYSSPMSFATDFSAADQHSYRQSVRLF
jgi:hypothetical protein